MSTYPRTRWISRCWRTPRGEVSFSFSARFWSGEVTKEGRDIDVEQRPRTRRARGSEKRGEWDAVLRKGIKYGRLDGFPRGVCVVGRSKSIWCDVSGMGKATGDKAQRCRGAKGGKPLVFGTRSGGHVAEERDGSAYAGHSSDTKQLPAPSLAYLPSLTVSLLVVNFQRCVL